VTCPDLAMGLCRSAAMPRGWSAAFEGSAAAGVEFGDEGAQQFVLGHRAQLAGLGRPGASAGERAEADVRSFQVHDPSDAFAGDVAYGLAGGGQATVGHHRSIPFVIASASAWATGAEHTPR
jgi:hypothetical protein